MRKKQLSKITMILCVAVLLTALALPSPAGEVPARVEFHLRELPAEPGRLRVDITVKFSLEGGEEVILEPDVTTPGEVDEGRPERLVFNSLEPEWVELTPLDSEAGGWRLNALERAEVVLGYEMLLEGRTGVPPVISGDLKLLKGSELLLPPRFAEGADGFVGEGYTVSFFPVEGDSFLAPWKPAGENIFRVDEAGELLDNFIAWGPMSRVEGEAGDVAVEVGFTTAYLDFEEETLDSYASGLLSMLDRARRVFGGNKSPERVMVIVTGASLHGLTEPRAESQGASVVLFHGGRSLLNEAAAAASGAMFDIWNQLTLPPEPSGSGEWLQDGLPGLYALRLPVLEGLMDPDHAYERLAETYAAYASNPLSSGLVLSETYPPGSEEEASLAAKKSTVLCASMAQAALERSDGNMDLDRLVGELSTVVERPGQSGYTLVDIEELLEEATGGSWTRYFDERVRGTTLMSAAEFSSTELLGSEGPGVSGRRLTSKGSAGNWAMLAAAALVIILVPIVMGPYVRRAVKLDVSMMPRVFDYDEDEEEEAGPGGGDEASRNT